MSILSDERKPDSDTCAMCMDAKTIVLLNGERYRVCPPNSWKNYECVAKQLVTLNKTAHAELHKLPKPSK